MKIRTKNSTLLLLLIVLLIGFFPSCGKDEEILLSISGDITLNKAIGHVSRSTPVYVIITKTMDVQRMIANPEKEIVVYVRAENTNNRKWKYDIDLIDEGVMSGDDIFIFAYVEKGNSITKIPLPSHGDYVGMYNQNNVNPVYELEDGVNDDADVEVSRIYLDINTSIEGTVDSDENGPLILIAFADDAMSSGNANADNINLNKVVAFSFLKKSSQETNYTLEVLPYLPVDIEFPIDNISVFAVLDSNDNGRLDDGEKIGFHRLDGNEEPAMLTIESGESGILTDIDITLDRAYYKTDVTVAGSIETAAACTATILAYQGSGEELFPTTLDHQNVLGYSVVDLVPGSNPYTIDMLPFYSFPIDEVSFFALVDENDNQSPDDGEAIGFYMDTENMKATYTIPEEGLTGIDIVLDKVYHTHDAYIEGYLLGDVTGEITIIAYSGDLENVSLENFDLNNVAGIAVLTKETISSKFYSVKMLPHFEITSENPLTDVSVFAINDDNSNSALDDGEKFGFYQGDNGKPGILTVGLGTTDSIDITLNRTYYNTNTTIKGNIQSTLDWSGYAVAGATVVAYQGIEDQLFPETIESENILGYTIVDLKSGSTPYSYTINMLPFSELPASNVSLFVLVDEDDDGVPDDGEAVGIYMNSENMSTKFTLPTEGLENMNIDLEKTYHLHSAAISGSILGDETGHITLVAYTGNIENVGADDFSTDNVAAYTVIEKSAAGSLDYSVKILPLFDVPLANVSFFALIDANGNSALDDGEKIGFYQDASGRPIILNVESGTTENVDITIDRTYYETDTRIEGFITKGNESFTGFVRATVIAYQGDGEELYPEAPAHENILGYTVIDVDFDGGAESNPYTINMIPFNTFPQSNVSLFVLVDDNENDLADPGEMVGFYVDNINKTTSFTVVEEGLNDMNIELGKTYNVHNAFIEGSIHGSDTGNILLLAYVGDLEAEGISNFDLNSVAAYTVIEEQDVTDPVEYSAKILPQFEVTLDNVSVFVIGDANKNGTLDDGEKVGFHADGSGKPASLSVAEGTLSNIDISLDRTYSQNNAVVKGNIEAAGAGTATIVAYAGSAEELFPSTLEGDNILGYAVKEVIAGSNQYTLNMLPFGTFPQDNVSIFALMDVNENSLPDPGEMIGFYLDTNTMKPQITIPEGELLGIDIDLDKYYYNHTASILGEIQGDIEGDITVVAYVGDMQSLDIDNFDVNNIAAFTKINKSGSDSVSYSMNLLPYFDVPLENVFVAAIREEGDENYMIDDGERIGYYQDVDGLPLQLTLNSGNTGDVNINLDRTYYQNTATVHGAVQGAGKIGTVTIVAYQGVDGELFPETIEYENVIGLSVIEKTTFSEDFTIDILPFYQSNQFPIENVSFFALMDDGDNVPEQGETIGFYMDTVNMTPLVSLSADGTTGIIINLDKTFNTESAAIEGQIQGDVTGDNITIIAYVGDIQSLDTGSLNINNIAAFTVIEKNDGASVDYSMKILPYFNYPLGNVYVAALKDNGDKIMSDGELVGYYQDVNSEPVALTINPGTTPGVNISLDRTYYQNSASVKGTIEGPDYGNDFMVTIVAYQGQEDEIFPETIEYESIIGYTIVEKNAEFVDYTIDILPFYQFPIENVSFFALVDNVIVNNVPDEGEMIGFYIDSDSMTSAVTLQDEVRHGVDIMLDKTYHEHDYASGDATISGNILGAAEGDITVIAYLGSLEDMGDTGVDIDVNKVVSFTVISKGAGPAPYSLKVLPQFGFPLGEVAIFAINDNVIENRKPDEGEAVGFYFDTVNQKETLHVPQSGVSGVDITIDKIYHEHEVYISGNIYTDSTDEITVVAYSGQLEDTDFDSFDINNVLAFTKVTKAGGESVSYDLRILPISPVPIEKISVFALVDNGDNIPDNGAGNNNPDPGELFGFYINEASKSLTFPISESDLDTTGDVTTGGVSGIDFAIAHKYNENDINIHGRIIASDSARNASGDLLVLAYSGDLDSMDMNDLDYTNVVMYKNCGPASFTYSAFNNYYYYDYDETVLPVDFTYSSVDLSNVNVFAVIDVNNNGFPDAGDRVGLHLDSLNPRIALPTADDINIDLSKIMYDHDMTVRLWLNGSSATSLPEGKEVLLLILDESGAYTGSIFNLFSKFLPGDLGRYTLGLKKTIVADKNFMYELSIAPIIDDQITWPPAPLQTLVYAIADTNNDGHFNISDDYAYYGECGLAFCVQNEYTLTNDAVQSLDNDYPGRDGIFDIGEDHMRFRPAAE